MTTTVILILAIGFVLALNVFAASAGKGVSERIEKKLFGDENTDQAKILAQIQNNYSNWNESMIILANQMFKERVKTMNLTEAAYGILKKRKVVLGIKK